MKARCDDSVIPIIERQKQERHDCKASWSVSRAISATSVLRIVLVLNS